MEDNDDQWVTRRRTRKWKKMIRKKINKIMSMMSLMQRSTRGGGRIGGSGGQ